MDGKDHWSPSNQEYLDPLGQFPVVDPHHHLWDLHNYYYPWLCDEPAPITVGGDSRPLRRNYLVEDYLADCATQNVVGSVHVEANYDPTSPLQETEWVESVFIASGIPSAHVAHAPLHEDDIDLILERHASVGICRGVRHILNYHSDPVLSFSSADMLKNDSWWRGFSRLDKYGLSFDLQIYPEQLHDAARLAATHTETLIVLNHTGMPYDQTRNGLDLWRDGMSQVAACENVFVKISGLGMVNHYWSVETIRDIVRQTIEMFGVDRCMFASNFPVDGLYSSYDDLYSAFKSIVADVSSSERRKLFYGAAVEAYRLW